MIKVVSVCWLKIVTNSLTLLPRRKMVFVSFPWTCAGSLPTLTIEYSGSHTLLSCRVPLINCHLFKQPLLKPSFCALRKLNKPYREAPSERKKGPWLTALAELRQHPTPSCQSCEWAILKTNPPVPVEPNQLTMHGNVTTKPHPNCRFMTKVNKCWGFRL